MSSSRFQAASLVASPSYPNAVAWSDENLVAVASGNLITILNPAKPFGSRGLVTISSREPCSIGVIERQDLISDRMLPVSLSRGTRPCARSISWSPVGLAPNSGCLLAVCTTEGQVKLYRMPFCEYSAEWVEVKDISEMLYAYLLKINFGEEQQLQDNREQECANDLPISILRNKCKRRRQNAPSVAPIETNNLTAKIVYEGVPWSLSKAKPKDCSVSVITAQQYASRNDMLASLVVAWSPILPKTSSSYCSVLAVGGKCGRISFWRIHGPRCCSLSNNGDSISVILIGFLQAHDAWITTISWALLDSNGSSSQFLLASGSCEGSVKIWKVNGEEMLESSEDSHASFSLLKEVMTVDAIGISVLSLIVPVQSPWKLFLAIGKGSGTVEVWMCEFPTSRLEKIGCSDAHNHMVMGLAWAFDGRCLYSCSQDNSLKSWILHGNSFCEVPSPSNIPGVKCCNDVPDAFDSCFGVAVSPGNLVIAVVRRFDSNLLNPMYQERTQKASLDFHWTGGEQLDISSNVCMEFDVESCIGFPHKELIWWEKNILWALSHCEILGYPLIVWDIVAALLAFEQTIPEFVEHILRKWLISYFGSQFDTPTFLPEPSKFLSGLSTRQLHLLNIISRRVVLKELGADKNGGKEQELEGLSGVEEEQLNLWTELLSHSERELQERLVGVSLSSSLSVVSNSKMDSCEVRCWSPIGLAQMEQWVSLNYNYVKDNIKILAAEVGKREERRLMDICEYEVEEKCSFCSATVPFESAEFAFCLGVKGSNRIGQRHKLVRCAVTMLCCPISPLWFCICCQRWASKLAPLDLFTMPGHVSDFETFSRQSSVGSALPYCPFCGILLQRLQPDFLLSPSPV